VKYLLATQNADVHVINEHGESCLHLAVDHGRVEVVRYLLAKFPGQVLLAKTDNDGDTPLHCTIHDLEVARLLLKNGASVINAVNTRRSSPLHEVASYGTVHLSRN